MAKADPFHVVFTRLLAEREMTPFAVTRATKERFDWGSAQTIASAARGELVPSREGMERIAAVLEVDPAVFGEYRLAVVREQLDWREVGLAKALKTLDGLGS